MTRKNQVIFSSILGIILIGVIFFSRGIFTPDEHLDEIAIVDTVQVKEVVYKYGLPIDDYSLSYGVVKRGQNLSSILSAHGFSMREIHDLNIVAKPVFDPRKIRVGNSYALFVKRDTVQQDSSEIIDFFVYENSTRDYVVFDLRDSTKVYFGEHDVNWKPKKVHGEVESSLWNAMPNYGANPLLAIELDKIYAWTIDFFGIAKGDKFDVLYEEEYVEDRSLQEFKIKGACFTHLGEKYYAIPFTQNGNASFYDEEGKNLEKAFLKAPLNFFRISSRFSNSRFHPVLKRYRPHHGVDYAAPTGTPVFSVGDGVVIARTYQARGAGYYIKIKHNSAYQTTYMHLSRFAKGLKVGDRVKQKQVIGYVGSTGLSTGPHLDFRVHRNGTPVNPLTMKSEPKESIKEENMAQFAIIRDSIISQLNQK